MVTTVERLVGWASEVALTDIPAPVLVLSRAQRRSVLGAIAASTEDGAARRVLGGVETWMADGPVPVPGTKRSARADDAIYAATVLSIALDFDDYVSFGHTGHSGVLVPLLLAAETGATGDEQMVAQAVANEIEARLGGACLLGPLNGQLWSFIHCAGAALAAGRLLGLDRCRLAHALAIALYQAPRPTVPGFMAPDSKLLTAAEPTLIGVRAARLAATGVTGPLDVLDHPQGFFDAFAYAPLPALLGGLGEGWATCTLSVKRYPGCAYVDTTVDAVLELGPIAAADVASIDVEAGLLTCEMDAMSQRYGVAGLPTPVTVNFSVAWNVAIAVVAGRLTPAETNETWLAEHHAELAGLAERVSLRHDWALTLRTADAMAPLMPPRALVEGTPNRELVGAVRRLRRDHEGLRSGAGDALALIRALRQADIRSTRRAVAGAGLWSPSALEAFAMTFPARVTITTRAGRKLVAETDVPLGGAGHASMGPEAVGREKFETWGPTVWGDEGTAAIGRAVDTDAGDLWSLLASTR